MKSRALNDTFEWSPLR